MKRVKDLFRYIWSIIKWFLAFIKYIIVDECVFYVWSIVTVPYIYFKVIYWIATPSMSYEEYIHKYTYLLYKLFKPFRSTDGEKIVKYALTVELWEKYRIKD